MATSFNNYGQFFSASSSSLTQNKLTFLPAQAASTPNTGSASTICKLPARSARSNNYQVALPTPPASNRPSLEGSTAIPANITTHDLELRDHQQAESPSLLSPPTSPPRVVQPLPLQAITSKVYSVANGEEETCTIEGVTPILFEELHSWGQENLPAWEGLRCEHLYTTCFHSFLTNLDKYRVDLHNDILVVGWPLSFGHEFITDLLDELRTNGHSFPRGVHGGKEVIIGGSADVRLSRGRKEPDCALYINGEDKYTQPTIAYEVGYSENGTKLTLDAARLICLTYGRVQLVVTIKITHKDREPGRPRELELITWDHWELVEVDEPVEHYRLDDPQPIDYDKMHIPTAYIAVVKSRNGKLRQLTARKVESHSVCTCHCFRDAGTFNLFNHSDFSRSPG
jgi:hypothetical protein